MAAAVSKRKKIGLIISDVVAWVVFVAVVLLAAAILVPMLFGVRLYSVQTGSMHPALPVGTVVVVEPVEFEEIAVGDVVTYNIASGAVVTHRVIGVNRQQRLLETKGDNNNTADGSPVSYDDVIGRVAFSIPYIGNAALLVQTRFGKMMIGIILFGLVGFSLLIRYYNREEDNEEDDEKEAEQTGNTENGKEW